MKRLGLRGKLFVVSFGLIVVAVLASGFIANRVLLRQLEDRIEAELGRVARVAQQAVLQLPDLTIDSVDPLTDRLGDAAGLRITVVDATGRVLGDSQLSRSEVLEVENHANRPEVAQALKTGSGTSRRHSATVRVPLLYSAVRYAHPDGSGVVRVAMPLDAVDAARRRLRMFLSLAGLVAIVLALGMSAFASQLMARTTADLVKRAREITRTVPDGSPDEIAFLAGSFNELASELESSLAALASERDRLQTVLAGLHDGLIAVEVTTGHHTISIINEAARRMLELEPDSVLEGRPLLDTVRIPALADLANRGVHETVHAELELGLTSPRTIEATATPLTGSPGAVIVLHDVTEVRRLEKVRRDFVANVSHELRTPISIILANSETLLGEPAGAEVQERLVSGLHRNARRLGQIVDELLELSRIEAREHHLATEALALAPAVHDALAPWLQVAEDEGVSIHAEVPDPLRVMANPRALERILSNLIDNAIKYTPRGGTVRVEAVEHEGQIELSVIDQGPGIDPIHHDRVFERFYRVDTGRSRAEGGTGLGLSIVKHLTEAMGGRCGIENVHPSGARFSISLRNAPREMSQPRHKNP